MPFRRSFWTRLSKYARVCAVAGCVTAAWTVPSVAESGTVAVTGDGTSTLLKPPVGDKDAKAAIDSPSGKKDRGKPGAKRGSKTETASREPDFGPSNGEHAIVALVNDEPVTGFEVDRRAMMLSGTTVQAQAKANFEAIVKNPKTSQRLKAILAQTIKANEGKSRDQIITIFEERKKEFGISIQKEAFEKARMAALPTVKKQALEELIDEKLKLQEAKKQNVTVEKGEVDRMLAGIAARNKMTIDEFTKQLGGSIEPIKSRIQSALSWNEVVKRKFGPLINVNNKDVAKLLATSTGVARDDVDLRVQRVRITLPQKMEENGIAQRIQEAEKIRSRFSDCKSTAAAAMGVPGAKFDDMGKRRPSTIPEPTRTMLLNASDGEMLPPSVGDGAVELYVVCGRDAVRGDDDKRSQVEDELKQKEFEVMAKRYLKDLREDAHIEYR